MAQSFETSETAKALAVIGDWSSRYTFVGVAGRFNTVMFAPLQPEPGK